LETAKTLLEGFLVVGAIHFLRCSNNRGHCPLEFEYGVTRSGTLVPKAIINIHNPFFFKINDMATSKPAKKKKANKDKGLFDKHFKLAFKKCSTAFNDVKDDLEKDSKSGHKADYGYYSKTLKGYREINARKEGFTLQATVLFLYKPKLVKKTQRAFKSSS
jgi:hypothetical protein